TPVIFLTVHLLVRVARHMHVVTASAWKLNTTRILRTSRNSLQRHFAKAQPIGRRPSIVLALGNKWHRLQSVIAQCRAMERGNSFGVAFFISSSDSLKSRNPPHGSTGFVQDQPTRIAVENVPNPTQRQLVDCSSPAS